MLDPLDDFAPAQGKPSPCAFGSAESLQAAGAAGSQAQRPWQSAESTCTEVRRRVGRRRSSVHVRSISTPLFEAYLPSHCSAMNLSIPFMYLRLFQPKAPQDMDNATWIARSSRREVALCLGLLYLLFWSRPGRRSGSFTKGQNRRWVIWKWVHR